MKGSIIIYIGIILIGIIIYYALTTFDLNLNIADLNISAGFFNYTNNSYYNVTNITNNYYSYNVTNNTYINQTNQSFYYGLFNVSENSIIRTINPNNLNFSDMFFNVINSSGNVAYINGSTNICLLSSFNSSSILPSSAFYTINSTGRWLDDLNLTNINIKSNSDLLVMFHLGTTNINLTVSNILLYSLFRNNFPLLRWGEQTVFNNSFQQIEITYLDKNIPIGMYNISLYLQTVNLMPNLTVMGSFYGVSRSWSAYKVMP